MIGMHLVKHDEGTGWEPHAHQRLLETGAEASNPGKNNLLPGALDGFVQRVEHLLCPVAAAAGPHTHGDARNRRHELGETRFPHFVERANVLDARHHLPPCFKVFSSRCRVRSLTWLRMW